MSKQVGIEEFINAHPEIAYANNLEQVAEDTRRGELLAELLLLKKKRDNGRYNTSWGDKTALGLFLSVKRIIEQGE